MYNRHVGDTSAWETQKLLIGNIGLGSDWAPNIEWKCKLDDTNEHLCQQYECEILLQRPATQLGFRYVQVTSASHSTMKVCDKYVDGNGRYLQQLWVANWHITVRFGFSPDYCSVHGHVFLAKDTDGILGELPDGTRKHVFDYNDRVLQSWNWVNSDAYRMVDADRKPASQVT